MIPYIRNKQTRLVNRTNTQFVRDGYMKTLRSKSRLVGLIGQRGVGKTTLLLQYLKLDYRASEYLYFAADDVYIADSTLYKIVDAFVRIGGKVVVIDEIHKYVNWAQELKSIYDTFPDLIIRFSGSSMLNILHEKFDLSRRAVTAYVEPLSFREYFALTQKGELPLLTLERVLEEAIALSGSMALEYPSLYKAFTHYLEIGVYPFFIEDEENYRNKLYNALEKVIMEDIPSLKKIDYTHLNLFKKLISKMAYVRVPFEVNITALSREFGISAPTLSNYLEIFESTRLIKPLRKYSKKLSKKPQKLLFGNTNILYTFSEALGVEAESGTVRETFFVSCFETIYYSDVGDFKVGDYTFEVGGRNKGFRQIKDLPKSYLVVDTDYTTEPERIPLWLFGLLR